jgi:hypothetical protein
MTTIPERLETLRRQLAGQDARVLSGDQLLVTRDLVPVPEQAGKANTYVPGVHGYQVHVACRSEPDYWAAEALSQRLTGAEPSDWDPDTMRLAVDAADLSPLWIARNQRGEIVMVRVLCGSDRVIGAVNLVLAQVEGVLLT